MRNFLSALLSGGLGAAIVFVYFAAQDRGSHSARAGDEPKAASSQADDAAIRKLATEFTGAFEKGDAAAIAAHYTPNGEFIRNDGEVIRGRAEIEKAYAEFFKGLTGKKKLEIQINELRFPSNDSAIAEVVLRMKGDDNQCVASSWRNCLFVREGGQWKVAVCREWDRDTCADDSLKDLEWLIGTWQVANKDREVTTTYEWEENKSFIRGKYSIKEGGKVVASGTQMIGKDNNDGVIRSWAFQSDAGFGGGIWTREGKKWSVDSHCVTASGQELTATNIYVHVDPNTYSWQSINRKLDGEPLPDLAPVKVTRQKK